MDISVSIQPIKDIYIELNFPVYDLNIHLEGSVSQNFDLGHSSYFMTKNG